MTSIIIMSNTYNNNNNNMSGNTGVFSTMSRTWSYWINVVGRWWKKKIKKIYNILNTIPFVCFRYVLTYTHVPTHDLRPFPVYDTKRFCYYCVRRCSSKVSKRILLPNKNIKSILSKYRIRDLFHFSPTPISAENYN